MKNNTVKKLMMLMVVLVLAIGVTACGADKYADSPYLGTWTATTAEYAGFEMEVESLFAGGFTVTLEADGDCIINVDGEENTGGWEPTETGFLVEGEIDFPVEDGVAVIDYEGVAIQFEQQ